MLVAGAWPPLKRATKAEELCGEPTVPSSKDRACAINAMAKILGTSTRIAKLGLGATIKLHCMALKGGSGLKDTQVF